MCTLCIHVHTAGWRLPIIIVAVNVCTFRVEAQVAHEPGHYISTCGHIRQSWRMNGALYAPFIVLCMCVVHACVCVCVCVCMRVRTSEGTWYC